MSLQRPSSLSSIVVLGQLHHVWPLAALLSHELPASIKLTVVEDSTSPVPQGGLSLPLANAFHRRLKLRPADLLQHCQGTFGLGTEFRDWQGVGSHFFAAHSGTLPKINGVALHHVMLRAAQLSNAPEKLAEIYEPFRFAARAALSGKCEQPPNDLESPLALLGPTLQLSFHDYIQYLVAISRSNYIQRVQARATSLTLSSDNKCIRSVKLDSDQEITGDLFIDVSGDVSKLYPETDKNDFRSLSKLIPFDRIGILKGEKRIEALSHRVAKAASTGVSISTPLRDSSVTDVVFSSESTTKSGELGARGHLTNVIPFSPGYSQEPWRHNLLRMGRASSSLGPIMSADMRVLQQEALYLTKYIPAKIHMKHESQSYNTAQYGFVHQIRDFCLLPMVLNGRKEPLWSDIRVERLPESFDLILKQFSSRGRFMSYGDHAFDEQLWIDMMIGFGVIPDRYNALAEAIDIKAAFSVLQNLDQVFSRTIQGMRSQPAYLHAFLAAE